MTDVEEFPTLDIALLRDLVFWAEGDEQHLSRKLEGDWEQDVWAHQMRNGVCRTAYCIAGQTVVQAGHNLAFKEEQRDPRFPDPNKGTTHLFASCTTEGESIEDLARRIIGLTWAEAGELFEPENSLDDVKDVARYICSQRGLSL